MDIGRLTSIRCKLLLDGTAGEVNAVYLLKHFPFALMKYRNRERNDLPFLISLYLDAETDLMLTRS